MYSNPRRLPEPSDAGTITDHRVEPVTTIADNDHQSEERYAAPRTARRAAVATFVEAARETAREANPGPGTRGRATWPKDLRVIRAICRTHDGATAGAVYHNPTRSGGSGEVWELVIVAEGAEDGSA